MNKKLLPILILALSHINGSSADLAIPPRVISKGEKAGTYQAFPDICRSKSGELFCVFYAGYAHVSLPSKEWPSGGRICAIRSADEGRNWSEPEIVYDSA